jgi:hypothetical protein
MSNLSDRDIDQLSREAADSYEPDHSSLSWSRLEQKLVEQIPERPPDGFRFSRINPFVWGAVVIIIAGLSVFTIKNFNYSRHSTRTNLQLTDGVTTRLPDNTKLSGAHNHSDSLNSVHVVTTVNSKKPDVPIAVNGVTDKTAASLDKSVSVNPGSKVQRIGPSNYDALNKSGQILKRISGKKTSESKSKNYVDVVDGSLIIGSASKSRNLKYAETRDDKTRTGHSNYTSTSTRSTTGSNSLFPDGKSSQIENSVTIATKHDLPLVVSSYTLPETIKGNDSLMNLLAHTGMPITHKSLRVNRSLNFGLSFGPDYTDAGGITNNQLGNNIGLTFGYYLTNKISLNTGIFYSNKFFWAPGRNTINSTSSNYRPWAAAAPPPIDYINGSTNIWEVPLTIRYDFAQGDRTKFFLNAGLSSYFVMKQTYINFFYSGQRLLAFKTYDDEQLNYWFKVADISFGFETELGKGFSFQAEPFFKLPLTNMGTNNLKLNSYGFLLSFRYSPVLSRSKK